MVTLLPRLTFCGFVLDCWRITASVTPTATAPPTRAATSIEATSAAGVRERPITPGSVEASFPPPGDALTARARVPLRLSGGSVPPRPLRRAAAPLRGAPGPGVSMTSREFSPTSYPPPPGERGLLARRVPGQHELPRGFETG